jgi:hypothetical protein
MTSQNISNEEAEITLRICECGKPTSVCGTTEICLTCVRKLNPKEFRETLNDLLVTWVASRPDIEVQELESLCPAIGSMIKIHARDPADAEDEFPAGI